MYVAASIAGRSYTEESGANSAGRLQVSVAKYTVLPISFPSVDHCEIYN
jgi:hypothetical protein